MPGLFSGAEPALCASFKFSHTADSLQFSQSPLVLTSTQLYPHFSKRPPPGASGSQPFKTQPPPLRAPYQFTVSAASFSAMNGRSPLASHTARQMQRRRWGIAKAGRPPRCLQAAGRAQPPGPRPPEAAVCCHPNAAGASGGRGGHPQLLGAPLAGKQGETPPHSPVLSAERLNPESRWLPRPTGGWRGQIVKGIRETLKSDFPGKAPACKSPSEVKRLKQ